MARNNSVVMSKSETAAAKKELKQQIADLNKAEKTAAKEFAGLSKAREKAANAAAKEIEKLTKKLEALG